MIITNSFYMLLLRSWSFNAENLATIRNFFDGFWELLKKMPSIWSNSGADDCDVLSKTSLIVFPEAPPLHGYVWTNHVLCMCAKIYSAIIFVIGSLSVCWGTKGVWALVPAGEAATRMGRLDMVMGAFLLGMGLPCQEDYAMVKWAHPRGW